jgi:magnesium-protoporphyrin O-methyltransferase
MRAASQEGDASGYEVDAMSTTTTAMGSFYDEKRAASELRKYRERGPIPSTRALIEALKAEGVEGATLLDIGGGIGAIQHELLDAGAAHATSVDASAPYLDTARAESERRGHDGRVTYVHGDFLDLADSIAPAEIVTLDRVINVYPGWERLAGLAAGHAERVLGLVYPRDTRMVRLVIFAMNLMLRLQRKPVRASIRPGDAIDRIAHANGLARHVSRDVGPAWHVAVFRRA